MYLVCTAGIMGEVGVRHDALYTATAAALLVRVAYKRRLEEDSKTGRWTRKTTIYFFVPLRSIDVNLGIFCTAVPFVCNIIINCMQTLELSRCTVELRFYC